MCPYRFVKYFPQSCNLQSTPRKDILPFKPREILIDLRGPLKLLLPEYSSLHFRFCFFVYDSLRDLSLTAKIFIDSHADFGFRNVFKFFTKNFFYLKFSSRADLKEAKNNNSSFLRYVSCLSSKELLSYVCLFMQFKNIYFPLYKLGLQMSNLRLRLVCYWI